MVGTSPHVREFRTVKGNAFKRPRRFRGSYSCAKRRCWKPKDSAGEAAGFGECFYRALIQIGEVKRFTCIALYVEQMLNTEGSRVQAGLKDKRYEARLASTA